LGWSDLASIIDRRYHYIRAPRAELYDIVEDPGELQDLGSSHAVEADRLVRRLAQVTQGARTAGPGPIPPGVRERLKSLGYVGSAGAPVGPSGALPDPKALIGSFEQFKQALGLERQGRTNEAIAVYRSVLVANPRMVDAWESLAKALVASGKTREAIGA